MPVLATVPQPVTREVTAAVTDPATGDTTAITGTYLVQQQAQQ